MALRRSRVRISLGPLKNVRLGRFLFMGAIAQQPPAGVRFAQERVCLPLRRSSVRISLGPLRTPE